MPLSFPSRLRWVCGWTHRTGRLGGLLVLGLLLAPGVWGASFQVSPTRFEFSLERRFTDFFTVTNNSGEPLRLRVTTAFLEPDAAGTLQPQTKHPYDLSPWLVLNPRRITLDPAEKRVVRFSVRPPGDLAPGEYRTVVFFEELPPRPGEGEAPSSGFRIQILTRLGVTIYGRVGEPQPDLKMEAPNIAVKADGVHVTALLHNAGTAHSTLDLVATLRTEAGDEAGQETARVTLQRNQRRPTEVVLPRPPAGTYRLRLEGQAEGRTLWQEERPVTVAPSDR